MNVQNPPRWKSAAKIGFRCLALSVVGVAVVLAIAVVVQDWLAARGGLFADAEKTGLLASGEAPDPENFVPVEAVPRPPLVRDFEILSPEEAEDRVRDEELVLAVAVNGEARAWPLNVMTGPEREVFNDKLGERPIAATW